MGRLSLQLQETIPDNSLGVNVLGHGMPSTDVQRVGAPVAVVTNNIFIERQQDEDAYQAQGMGSRRDETYLPSPGVKRTQLAAKGGAGHPGPRPETHSWE